jgi:hypothetical protein
LPFALDDRTILGQMDLKLIAAIDYIEYAVSCWRRSFATDCLCLIGESG